MYHIYSYIVLYYIYSYIIMYHIYRQYSAALYSSAIINQSYSSVSPSSINSITLKLNV